MPTGRIQVAPGQTIQSAEWGNPLWDHSVQCFASAADRTNQFPAPQPGAVSFTEDTKTLWVYVNGAWTQVPIGPAATGQGNVTGIPANGNASVAVTYPAGRFSSTPMVVCSAVTSGPQNAIVAVLSVSATGFTASGFRSTAGNVLFNWIAVSAP